MTISPLALDAKKVIDAAWLNGDAYDLSSQAAFALESAQLLQSPETAAEAERVRQHALALEAAAYGDAPVRLVGAVEQIQLLHSGLAAQKGRAETLDRLLREAQARVAELEAQREALAERLRAGQQWQRGRNPELVSENFVSQSELRCIFGIPLTAPWDEDPAMPAEADGIVRRIAPVQAYREEDPFGLHHTYRVPRDLPETGGAR